MSSITKREFATLDITGINYLTWAFYVKIHLRSLDLSRTILSSSNDTSAHKAKALVFIRHHLYENLKVDYLTEEDLVVLWQSLKDRYDHQQDVVLPMLGLNGSIYVFRILNK
ncbi:hypothetical protein CFOL_v3_29887 [Cephalotus follicularis]|uniref:UBN2_3 domain-containing protein n=1 Tax=Cephalotus follicularis TaxID=3775 RepID=A0A1Q3D1V1_CEPFO|nr:hypothetical protein CFOL_v3_29887 [Cephalotus follicularis]